MVIESKSESRRVQPEDRKGNFDCESTRFHARPQRCLCACKPLSPGNLGGKEGEEVNGKILWANDAGSRQGVETAHSAAKARMLTAIEDSRN